MNLPVAVMRVFNAVSGSFAPVDLLGAGAGDGGVGDRVDVTATGRALGQATLGALFGVLGTTGVGPLDLSALRAKRYVGSFE